jgi:hypothetical protein
MTDLECDPDQLYTAAATLNGIGDRLDALDLGDPEPDLWGPLGRAVGADGRYRELAATVHAHVAAAVRFCEVGAGDLRRAADAYAATEHGIGVAMAAVDGGGRS